MLDIVKQIKKDIQTNGVSKSDIKILEDTIGEPIVSSVLNIKSLTTERSFIDLEAVVSIIDEYVDENTKEGIENTLTISDITAIANKTFGNLTTIKNSFEKLSVNFSEEIKNRFLNTKERYRYITVDGVDSTDVYDIFDVKAPIYYVMSNPTMISSLVSDDDARRINLKIVDWLATYDVIKNFSTHNIESFLILNLIFNKEVDSFINDFNFTPYTLNGNDLIKMLDNAYIYKEYTEECFARILSDYTIKFKNLSNGYDIYNLESIKRLKRLNDSAKATTVFLEILTDLITSMCKL